MPRIQLFEFEDLPWFPDAIRTGMTDFLDFAITHLKVYQPAVPLLGRLLATQHSPKMVDLGSGGGGGIVFLLHELRHQGLENVTITLTDKYPNIVAFQQRAQEAPHCIGYVAESVDALQVPSSLAGVRTLFSASHHLTPEQLQRLLRDAVQRCVPIGLFDGACGQPLEWGAAMLLLAPAVWAVTPFIRPVTLNRLFFTYAIPLIPCCTLWDGLVSLGRMYSPRALMALAYEVEREAYVWQAGMKKGAFGTRMTYLIGYPKEK
ncbi:hypothetical protein SAMN05421823_11017 [Catalinimonas alkaloidigena]|uniref:Methyltransferase domain-containing protein n=1 Tax=Catalinimonas alkaloidigena TaxID=1075417 RepID=A0A1G9Q2F9_9BACT|nr:hypothetical protein [Catalinimonas alkaloidigena]SDM05190.1 hypothetical protein SAMN05421823_11017 [Catalinimonas alkaloidigena]